MACIGQHLGLMGDCLGHATFSRRNSPPILASPYPALLQLLSFGLSPSPYDHHPSAQHTPGPCSPPFLPSPPSPSPSRLHIYLDFSWPPTPSGPPKDSRQWHTMAALLVFLCTHLFSLLVVVLRRDIVMVHRRDLGSSCHVEFDAEACACLYHRTDIHGPTSAWSNHVCGVPIV